MHDLNSFYVGGVPGWTDQVAFAAFRPSCCNFAVQQPCTANIICLF